MQHKAMPDRSSPEEVASRSPSPRRKQRRAGERRERPRPGPARTEPNPRRAPAKTPRTSLAAAFPELAAQWHPTKNAPLVPDQVTVGSHKTLWWKCARGPDHEWQAQVHKRTFSTRGCPFCAGQRASMTNSLATAHPELAAQWHRTMNGPLAPDQVTAGSARMVWWKCPRGPDHEWRAAIASRSAGRGCPFCSGRRVSVTNSLAVRFPGLAAQWHPTRNGRLRPDRLIAHSRSLVWWKCPQAPDHVWRAPAYRRAVKRGCPFCTGRRASVTNSLAALFADLAAQWHPTRNGRLRPEHVAAHSDSPVWWRCPRDPRHEWQAKVSQRTRLSGSGCPFCANRSVSKSNSLAAVFPKLVLEWHPTRNAPLRPEQVLAHSHRKVWWQCPADSEHQWQAEVAARAYGQGCPVCARRRIRPRESLQQEFPDHAAEWHSMKNGSLTPDQVPARSTRLVWWKCPLGSDHEWRARVADRTRGNGCPFCARRRVPADQSLAACFPPLAAEWHPTRNGPLLPEAVLPGSRRMVWWRCTTDPVHEWQAPVRSRTMSKSGGPCPICNRSLARRGRAGRKETR
jgi:hypothetical protein